MTTDCHILPEFSSYHSQLSASMGKIMIRISVFLAVILAFMAPITTSAYAKSASWQMKCKILNQVNAYRFRNGKSCLVTNRKLQKAAQQYANWFARNMTKGSGVKLSHKADGRSPGKRARDAGYKPLVLPPKKVVRKIKRADGRIVTKTTIYRRSVRGNVGENVLYYEGIDNCKTGNFPGVAFKDWRNSKVHRINMLSAPWNATGIGIAMNRANKRCFGVQLFGIAKVGKKACQLDCSIK